MSKEVRHKAAITLNVDRKLLVNNVELDNVHSIVILKNQPFDVDIVGDSKEDIEERVKTKHNTIKCIFTIKDVDIVFHVFPSTISSILFK